MSEELKCRCGGNGTLHTGVYSSFPSDYWITCDSCDKETGSHTTEQAALEEWGDPRIDAPRAELAIVTADYNRLRDELANRYVEVHDLRAELATARAEAERLRGVIKVAEWSDMTMVDNRPYLFAPACPICEVERGNEHQDYCSFYRWEAPHD